MAALDEATVTARRRRGATQLLAALAVLPGLLLALPLAAETNYVVDRLLVGVHETKDLNSAIIKVLPTGTQLEVLARDGELVQVEDPEKVRGWVDATYLTAERPATLRVAELERENARLEQAVASAAAGAAPAATDGNAGGGAQVDALTKENTGLKAKLSEQRLRAGQLQSEVASLRAQVSNQDAPPDQRIVELERERGRLSDALEEAEETITELSARASLTATADLIPVLLKEYALATLLLLVVIVIAAAALGAWAVDAVNRRRHGGFRV